MLSPYIAVVLNFGIFILISDCLNIAVDESESQCSCKLFQQKCKQGDESSLKIIMRITLSGTLKYFLDQEGEGGRWGWGQGLMFFTQTIFASKNH